VKTPEHLKPFAKVFDTAEGQVMFYMDSQGEQDAQFQIVVVYHPAIGGLDVSQTALGYKSRKKAREDFDKLTPETALSILREKRAGTRAFFPTGRIHRGYKDPCK
jgi:hypothetical protein